MILQIYRVSNSSQFRLTTRPNYRPPCLTGRSSQAFLLTSAMQAVPLALNSSVMAAFKSPSLSPPSAELAQTLGKMGGNSVYEISATTSPPVTSPSDIEEKYRLGEDMMGYSTQYYTSVEGQSRGSSPGVAVMAASPKDSTGNLTPVSVSSKETSSSSDATSVLGDDHVEVLGHQSMCIPISTASQQHGEEGATSSTQIKHWTYEDQFKQVRPWCMAGLGIPKPVYIYM